MPKIDTDLILQKSNEMKSDPEYPLEQVFQILYDNLPSVKDKDYDTVLDSSKYVRLARDYDYANYKLCTYKDIIDLKLSNSMTEYQKKFISRNGAVIVIFNTLNNKPISTVFRAISQKEFMDFSLVYSIYGFDMIDESFKYGDTLVITEGQYDADSLRHIYKNVVATQTSNITLIQSMILKSMTDKFVIAFDNDTAGFNGFEKAVKRLGDNIKKLPIYKDDKDIGIMEEVKANKWEYEDREKFYRDAINDCMSGELGFSL